MREVTMQRQGRPSRKASAARDLQRADSFRVMMLGALLVAGTVFLYSQVKDYSFINWDDNKYITENTHVTSGLSIANLIWSFSSFEACNWHPLTWISHQLDCELFGTDAGYHHLVNVLFHTLNVLLLFLILYKFTGYLARSFLVAALFAWHPFNVESVAWIAERKTLLSTFWFFCALGAYGYYALRPQLRYYAVVAACFVLALAAKPMAVTLPFVLVLLDYWPLQRVQGWTNPNTRLTVPQSPPVPLIFEKVPLISLSIASSVVTILSQRDCALRTLTDIPLLPRLENGCYCYLLYMWKAVLPLGFSLLYPLIPVSKWKAAVSLMFLIAVGIEVWRQRILRPYLIVGWLWYLGALIPMIGIVQVGRQAMADRYAYIPLIGIFIILTWLSFETLDSLRVRTSARIAACSAVLVVLALLTHQQIKYWQSSTTIWSRTLEVTRNNWVAEGRLGSAYQEMGDLDQAIVHFKNEENNNPLDIANRVNLGLAYGSQGRLREAINELDGVVKSTDGEHLSDGDRHYRCAALLNLGFAFALSGDYQNATISFQRANQTDDLGVQNTTKSLQRSIAVAPTESDYLNLSLLLRAQGKRKEARSLLERAERENGGYQRAAELLEFMNHSGGL